MASVKIDPEGGSPVYSGEGATGNNTKQANADPQAIPVDQPNANTTLPGDPWQPHEAPEK